MKGEHPAAKKNDEDDASDQKTYRNHDGQPYEHLAHPDAVPPPCGRHRILVFVLEIVFLRSHHICMTAHVQRLEPSPTLSLSAKVHEGLRR